MSFVVMWCTYCVWFQLFALFSEFAKEESQVGMTVVEFRRFLIESQKASHATCH